MKNIVIIFAALLLFISCSSDKNSEKTILDTQGNKNVEYSFSQNNGEEKFILTKKKEIKGDYNSGSIIENENSTQEIDMLKYYNQNSSIGLLDYNCLELKNTEVQSMCLIRKLNDTWQFKDLGLPGYCEEKFNVLFFPGYEDEAMEFKNKCKEEKEKLYIERLQRDKIAQKAEKFSIDDCEKKNFSYEEETRSLGVYENLESCRMGYALKVSPKGCDIFTNEEEKQLCLEKKNNIEKFQQMKSDYELFINYNVRDYIDVE